MNMNEKSQRAVFYDHLLAALKLIQGARFYALTEAQRLSLAALAHSWWAEVGAD